MNARIVGRAVLLPAVALASLPVLGQEQGQAQGQGLAQVLTLFQDDGASLRAQFQGAQQGGSAEAPTAPGLVLKGIYRFGDTYHVTLQGEDNAVFKTTWQEGQGSSIPVSGGYQLQGVDSRAVTLALPVGVSCEQAGLSGSSCLGRSQVSLSFAETAPVQRRTNNNNNTRTTNQNNNNNRGNNTGGVDIRALFEAAGGDDRAREAIQTLLRDRIQGQGGNNQTQGNRGGRGGGGGGTTNNNGGGRGRGGFGQ